MWFNCAKRYSYWPDDEVAAGELTGFLDLVKVCINPSKNEKNSQLHMTLHGRLDTWVCRRVRDVLDDEWARHSVAIASGGVAFLRLGGN